MLSPSSPSQAGIGSGVRCSASSAQHPACSSATGTTYLTPTSKTLQSHASDGLQTSAIGSGASIPYSHYGGSKSVAPTIMSSSLMHRKKPLLTRSEVSHPARQDAESVEESRLSGTQGGSLKEGLSNGDRNVKQIESLSALFGHLFFHPLSSIIAHKGDLLSSN